MVFWVVILCSDVVDNQHSRGQTTRLPPSSDDGGDDENTDSMVLLKGDILPHRYMVSQPRRPCLESSSLWKLQILIIPLEIFFPYAVPYISTIHKYKCSLSARTELKSRNLHAKKSSRHQMYTSSQRDGKVEAVSFYQCQWSSVGLNKVSIIYVSSLK